MESGVDIDNLVKRVKVLEEERKSIDEEIKKCTENNINRADVQDLATQIAEGLKDLEVNPQIGSLFERKQLIHQFVRQIIIDRTRMRAICYIKKIPTVTHKLVNILTPSERSVIIVAVAGSYNDLSFQNQPNQVKINVIENITLRVAESEDDIHCELELNL